MRIIKAFWHSIAGFKSCFKSEAAFREEFVVSVVLIPTAFYLAKNNIELVVLILPIIIMLIVEMLNTSIEHVVDRIGLEHNEMSGKAKDVASGAVLLSALLLIFVWIIVLAG